MNYRFSNLRYEEAVGTPSFSEAKHDELLAAMVKAETRAMLEHSKDKTFPVVRNLSEEALRQMVNAIGNGLLTDKKGYKELRDKQLSNVFRKRRHKADEAARRDTYKWAIGFFFQARSAYAREHNLPPKKRLAAESK